MQDWSPFLSVIDERLSDREIRLWMKRDDLLGGPASGNKIRKLKYQLHQAIKLNVRTLVTFGGAYSNHLFAVAGLGQALGLHTVGYVRSSSIPTNKTTNQLRKWGMKLIPLDRELYRKKEDISFLRDLQEQHLNSYLIPEGGSSQLAMPGIQEMVTEIREQCPTQIDYFVCPFGTGATMAGIAAELRYDEKVLGCMVLKGLEPKEMIRRFLPAESLAKTCHFVEAHYGGFAKCPAEVQSFIQAFYDVHGICLDPLYTGKMMKHLFELIDLGWFPRGSVIVAIHTGGLQGTAGYNERFGINLPIPKEILNLYEEN